jgi:hypothetical protein
MDNNDFDRGAALEILRYTIKVAAVGASSVGGSGPQAETQAALNPGGGQTQGGGNSPWFTNSYRQTAMAQALLRTFKANAGKQMAQNVNIAAGKQNTVGGMGTGVTKAPAAPKGPSFKTPAVKTSSVQSRLLLAKEAGLVTRLSKGVKAITDAVRKAKAPPVEKPPPSLDESISGLVNQYGKPYLPKDLLKVKIPKGTERYSVPEGGKWLGKGEGFRNIYRRKDPDVSWWDRTKPWGKKGLTDDLIKGPRGPFARKRAPEGYQLETPWHGTGGRARRWGKKALYGGALGTTGGYAGTYAANREAAPWDPKRLRAAVATGGTLAGFSSLPAGAAYLASGGYPFQSKKPGNLRSWQKAGLRDWGDLINIDPNARAKHRGGTPADIMANTAIDMRKTIGKGIKERSEKYDWSKINREILRKRNLEKALGKSTTSTPTPGKRK